MGEMGFHTLAPVADVRSDIAPSLFKALQGFAVADALSDDLTLTLGFNNFVVGNQNVRMRTYTMPGDNDDVIVGPVIRAPRNGEVKVMLENRLTGPDTLEYWFLFPTDPFFEAELEKEAVSDTLYSMLFEAQKASLWGESLQPYNPRFYDAFRLPWDSTNTIVNQPITQVSATQKSFQSLSSAGAATTWQIVKEENVANGDMVWKVFRSMVGTHDHANHNVPHDFNTTNLHTHGWHVSPKQDNIFRSVTEGQDSQYEYTLDNHPAGTFWYHPHVHGSTAIQVASGSSGALIVEDNAVTLARPEFAVLKEATDNEQVLVINQILFHPEIGELPDFNTLQAIYSVLGTPVNDTIYPRLNDSLPGTTINGVTSPILEMEAGTVQRFRVIHSGFRSNLAFAIPDGVTAYQISVDGLYFDEPREISQLHMAPGNRSDLIIVADTEGDYPAKIVPYSSGCEYFVDSSACTGTPGASAETFFTIRVSGNATPVDFALSSLPDNDIPIPNMDSVVGTRNIEFSIANNQFLVNDTAFQGSTYISQWPVGGTTERWVIKGFNGGHPYHIHVNPFQVYNFGGKAVDPPMWKDVVFAQNSNSGTNNTAEMITYYAPEYPGQFVLHCHILDHEDQGMMQNVSIRPANGNFPECLPDTSFTNEYNRTTPTPPDAVCPPDEAAASVPNT